MSDEQIGACQRCGLASCDGRCGTDAPAPAAVPPSCPKCDGVELMPWLDAWACPKCCLKWSAEPPASTPAAEPSAFDPRYLALLAVYRKTIAERDTALARVAQLEALVKQVEWGAGGACPWCARWLNTHNADCPAFGQPSAGTGVN